MALCTASGRILKNIYINIFQLCYAFAIFFLNILKRIFRYAHFIELIPMSPEYQSVFNLISQTYAKI